MREILALDHVALRPTGPALTLSVAAGQSLAIVGPAGGGKTRLLRMLAGRDGPGQGAVHLRGRAALVAESPVARRAKVHSLARRSGDASAQRVTEVLTALRLWDVRTKAVGELSTAQAIVCEFVEPLSGDDELIFIDGLLDALDPWTLRSTLDFLRAQMTEGRTFVVATQRPDIIRELDNLIAVSDQQVRFAGTVEDLLRAGPPHTIDVATENAPAVRAIVAPFQVSVKPHPDGMRLEAPEGQEVAARLLLDGYGDVKFVVMRPPTIEEALRALV